LFGIAVVVAPVVGPTLGGWISDNMSWQWCFYINGPVGVVTMGLIAAVLREPAERQRGTSRTGSISSASCWSPPFSARSKSCSTEGSRTTGSAPPSSSRSVGALAFVVMVPWEISSRNPAIDVRMVATRQFGSCFAVMLATGAILLSTTQFLPQLVQQDFGYTATWAGLVMSPGGLISMVMFMAVGRLVGKVQPKYLIIAGALVVAFSMYDLTNVYADVGFWFLARSRMLLGVGLPLIFLPILTASVDGVPSERTNQASALINAARNTGGSMGISLANNVLAHREQFHESRLVESVLPSSIQYQHTLHQVTDYFVAQGGSLLQAQQRAIQWMC
jgi:MFS transporter, DHA2 family, multidrug resistance protein